MHIIHMGVYAHFRRHPADADPDPMPSVDGHDDPAVEYPFGLATSVGTLGAYVSGSWACWGPADQESDGDSSLHVVVDVPDEQFSTDVVREAYRALRSRLADEDYLGDAICVTTDDWSVTTHVLVSSGDQITAFPVSKPYEDATLAADVRLAKEAAYGDSNDTEIEFLQSALDQALRALGRNDLADMDVDDTTQED